MVKNIFCGRKAARAAHDGNAFPDARGAVTRSRCGGEIEVDVIGDHQVEMAITVVIDKGAAISPGFARAGDTCFLADGGKSSVAIVAIKDVFSVVGDVEIFPAIIVIIADADSLPPTGVGQAGFARDLGESAVVIVMVEMTGREVAGGRRIESGAVNDEDVRPAIVVIVEDGDAGPGSLDDVFLGVHAAKDFRGRETCFFGDIGEMSDGFGNVFWELGSVKKQRKRRKQSKRNPGAMETETRTMGRTGNHELLAY